MMKTFEAIFCERHGCSPEEFSTRVFRRCLYRRAALLAPVIRTLNPRYFLPERHLVDRLRRVEKMNQVWEELREYFTDPRNAGWIRRKLGFRISGRRLIAFARDYLPSSGTPPSYYAES
jgi:hypothetical protein